MAKLRVIVDTNVHVGHGERFETLCVRTEPSRYGLYGYAPKDMAQARADADYINRLIEEDEKRQSEPTAKCPRCGGPDGWHSMDCGPRVRIPGTLSQRAAEVRNDAAAAVLENYQSPLNREVPL